MKKITKINIEKVRRTLSIVMVILAIIILVILVAVYTKNREKFEDIMNNNTNDKNLQIENIVKEQKEKNYSTYIQKVYQLGLGSIDNKYIDLNYYYEMYDRLH